MSFKPKIYRKTDSGNTPPRPGDVWEAVELSQIDGVTKRKVPVVILSNESNSVLVRRCTNEMESRQSVLELKDPYHAGILNHAFVEQKPQKILSKNLSRRLGRLSKLDRGILIFV